ncbi:MAG: hypothetical protein GY715_08305 [Planctomycetes bacterium]|nr:hypothetical protein [Planctomycetota bacterium]
MNEYDPRELPQCLSSSRIVPDLRLGKYTDWALGLSPQSLQTLLWAIGIFGTNYNELQALGVQPNPRFAPQLGSEGRSRLALEVIAGIQAGEDASGLCSNTFPDPSFAFQDQFKESLTGPLLSWTVDLDETQFYSLLWNVGEYAARVDQAQPPDFDGPGLLVSKMRVALGIVANVYHLSFINTLGSD